MRAHSSLDVNCMVRAQRCNIADVLSLLACSSGFLLIVWPDGDLTLWIMPCHQTIPSWDGVIQRIWPHVVGGRIMSCCSGMYTLYLYAINKLEISTCRLMPSRKVEMA